MNTYDYIVKTKISVHEYLEGFIIKNPSREFTDDERVEYLLKNFAPEVRAFYKDQHYRSALSKYITEVRVAYDNLISLELEFANNNEEVDLAVKQFENNLKHIIFEFQERIYEVIKGKEGYQTNTIKDYLKDIEIKVIKDVEQNNEIIDKPKDAVSTLYVIHNCIQTKCEIIFAYKTFIEKEYQKGTPEYREGLSNYMKMLNITDYDKFIEFYSKIPTANKPIIEDVLEETKPKSRS